MEGYTSVNLDSEKDKAAFVVMHTYFFFEMKEEIYTKKQSTTEEEVLPHLALSLFAKGWYYSDIQKSMEYKDKQDKS